MENTDCENNLLLWPSGDLQKSKRLRREAGEWEEEAENELKQQMGRTSLQSALLFSGSGCEGEQRDETEKDNARAEDLKSRGSVFRGKLLNSGLSDITFCRAT